MENVERFRKIAGELGDLYEKKDKCYNNSFGDTFNKLGIISAVTRISDKYNRLCNLATNPNIDDLDESLQDTLCDMASYCIMTIMELSGNELRPTIHKGDKFKCIKDVMMDDGEIAYRENGVYVSELNDCITDLGGVVNHYWEDNWKKYFKRIK